MKIIERFEVPYYQYLNEESELIADAPPLAANVEELIKFYKQMVFVRMIDAKAIALQRTGKLGTYPSTRGQEAVFVGVGQVMAKNDIFVPYYRDMATLLQRGVTLTQILLYWGGDERGNVFTSDSRDFPFSVPVGSQPLHAAGCAFTLKYRQEKAAVVTMCGDGATSQGDFYEAMNVAGAWQLPVVFIICNNQWAISVPRAAQTAASTLAQKAIAAGIAGEQVDGNDIIAIAYRTEAALRQAKNEMKPTLLEMVCYRQSDHTTADDATRYEPKEVREQQWKKEPVARLRHYLERRHAWDESQEEALQAACAKEIDMAVKEYLATPPQPPESMFDYLYASLPSAYKQQRELLGQREGNSNG